MVLLFAIRLYPVVTGVICRWQLYIMGFSKLLIEPPVWAHVTIVYVVWSQILLMILELPLVLKECMCCRITMDRATLNILCVGKCRCLLSAALLLSMIS